MEREKWAVWFWLGVGIGEGLTADLNSLRIHEADGIVFGTYITTKKQGL
jgi:hypothetical protein